MPLILRRVPLIAALVVALPLAASAAPAEDRRPNIVLIVADDLGYADLGAFGGEIHTPNLDALAQGGVRMTDFHTGPTCSPTRSMLFSGTDNHIAGLGSMEETTAPNQLGVPGYEGEMNHSVVSFVSLLRDAGYHTYMAGKWHLGHGPEYIPHARGFERDFSMLEGESSYFADMTGVSSAQPKATYTEDGKYVTRLPRDFYATEYYVDRMIQFVEKDREDGKPFFAYLAHVAPHAPYHLPNDWLRKYAGRYDMGWDALRRQRLDRMKQLGIVGPDASLAERMWFVPPYDVLAPAARVLQARKMELYASLVENMDFHTGRFLDYLKQTGEYDNTLFIFFSDNGAEGNDIAKTVSGQPGTRDFVLYSRVYSQTHPNTWGRPGATLTYGPMWAQASTTPFREYKGFAAEGGIRTPLIVAGTGVDASKGSIHRGLTHVMDIAPTILETAGIAHPDSYDGKPVAPVQGKSWLPVLRGEKEAVRSDEDWLGWEMWGSRAIRQGAWKLLWEAKPYGASAWTLYNLEEDPGERHDLSAKHPEKVAQLTALWDQYAATNHVILPNRTMMETHEKILPMRTPVDEGFPPMIFEQPFVPPAALVRDYPEGK